jgi:SHS2 domain-containing protein
LKAAFFKAEIKQCQPLNSKTTIPRWEHFEHGADIGIRGIASTLEQAFEQTAVAMTAVITNPDHLSASKAVSIRCEAPDNELLLLDWINELIYEMAVQGLLFKHFQVALNDGVLSATAFGETVDRQKHQPAVEIKGATFTELRVYQQPDDSWIAQCIVDV